MKKTYIQEVHASAPGQPVRIMGWVVAKRDHGKTVFLDIADSTGRVQVVIGESDVEAEEFALARSLGIEAAVSIDGLVQQDQRGCREVAGKSVERVASAPKEMSPKVRTDVDIFDERLADHLLANRHLYLRNPRVMAVLRFRHLVMGFIHRWFHEHEFVEITAPVLTTLPLYDNRSAMVLDAGGRQAYLTQCVGFYLEAAVHAFERVYNVGPSFRGEESRSKRHLMEYWHIKAEMAFAGFEDMVTLVETLLFDLTTYCEAEAGQIGDVLGRTIRRDALLRPFPRITYREAVKQAVAAGSPIQFGESLSSVEEELLSCSYDRPFWVTGIPRAIEPFPYVIDRDDPEVTRTADLILPAGYGELLGIAEKIHNLEELDERLAEKGKSGDERYEWLRELRQYGCVPHAGFGMGVERLLRWLLDIPHVRDAIPFPRIFRRRIYP